MNSHLQMMEYSSIMVFGVLSEDSLQAWTFTQTQSSS